MDVDSYSQLLLDWPEQELPALRAEMVRIGLMNGSMT